MQDLLLDRPFTSLIRRHVISIALPLFPLPLLINPLLSLAAPPPRHLRRPSRSSLFPTSSSSLAAPPPLRSTASPRSSASPVRSSFSSGTPTLSSTATSSSSPSSSSLSLSSSSLTAPTPPPPPPPPLLCRHIVSSALPSLPSLYPPLSSLLPLFLLDPPPPLAAPLPHIFHRPPPLFSFFLILTRCSPSSSIHLLPLLLFRHIVSVALPLFPMPISPSSSSLVFSSLLLDPPPLLAPLPPRRLRCPLCPLPLLLVDLPSTSLLLPHVVSVVGRSSFLAFLFEDFVLYLDPVALCLNELLFVLHLFEAFLADSALPQSCLPPPAGVRRQQFPLAHPRPLLPPQHSPPYCPASHRQCQGSHQYRLLHSFFFPFFSALNLFSKQNVGWWVELQQLRWSIRRGMLVIRREANND